MKDVTAEKAPKMPNMSNAERQRKFKAREREIARRDAATVAKLIDLHQEWIVAMFGRNPQDWPRELCDLDTWIDTLSDGLQLLVEMTKKEASEKKENATKKRKTAPKG